MKIELIDGDAIDVQGAEIKGEWVVARITTSPEANSRVIPRENIEQIIVMDDEQMPEFNDS